jgi:hypothetical protein
VLAVTTPGRSSAILHSKNRPLPKGLDVTAEPHDQRCGRDPSAVGPGRSVTRPLLANGPDGWIQIATFTLRGW